MADGTVIISDWGAPHPVENASTSSTSDSAAAIKTHLNGLKPIVIERHVEKTNWKRRATLKFLLIAACVLLASVAFAAVAYQYRKKMILLKI